MDVDVWVRGQQDAITRKIDGVPAKAADWIDGDVRLLLEQMLLALEKAKNPSGEAPPVSWLARKRAAVRRAGDVANILAEIARMEEVAAQDSAGWDAVRKWY